MCYARNWSGNRSTELTKEKGKEMPKEKGPGMPEENPKENDSELNFEIIDESEMEFAKRGRKSNLNPEFIEQMKKLQIGKLYAIREFQIVGETDKEIIKTKKSGIAMKLRSALRQANRQEFQIKWTTDLIPCVKVNK